MGEDAFGRALLVMTSTGTSVCMKEIVVASSAGELARIRSSVNPEDEGSLQQQLRHDHIIACTAMYALNGKIQLILEYMPGGDCKRALLERGMFSRCNVKRFVMQMASALAYDHRHMIAHRDIKLENIFM